MEDYDVFEEMQNIKDKRSLVVIEDDEDFIMQNLLDSSFEVMPIRFSYDLACFSSAYIDKTKELFIFYYNAENSYKNELLRLKKHFVHFQRKPHIAYVPNNDKYRDLTKMLAEIGIKCISDRENLLKVLNQKLIFIDSDETLRKSDGSISKRSKKVIKEIRKRGNRIIICTARPRYQTLEVMEEVGADPIVVSSNGAEIYDNSTKKVIFNSFITKDLVNELVEYAFAKDIRLILTTDDYEYVTKDVRNSKQKLLSNMDYKKELENCDVKQCMFIDKKVKEIYKIRDILAKNDSLHIVDEINENNTYEEKWFSVANKDCSKGKAVKVLARYLDIPIENTIAIGNDKNDISMFEVAGLSVAVANALEDIKSKVDYVTLTNDEDGVAFFLEKLLNKQQY